jgi:hypothetical protein
MDLVAIIAVDTSPISKFNPQLEWLADPTTAGGSHDSALWTPSYRWLVDLIVRPIPCSSFLQHVVLQHTYGNYHACIVFSALIRLIASTVMDNLYLSGNALAPTVLSHLAA